SRAPRALHSFPHDALPIFSLGLMVAGRLPAKDLIPYWIAQVLGAIAAAAVLYLVASGKDGFSAGGLASNGYGELSPGGYSMMARSEEHTSELQSRENLVCR